MLVLKLIFKGRLEFGSLRAYEMATKHYLSRTETIYRPLDILLKFEAIFDDENMALVIPNNNFVVSNTEKCWKATGDLLRELAQFAVAGSVKAWCMHEGNLVDNYVVEPMSEKSVVQDFRLGVKLVKEKGRETEAKDALTRAIERFQNHALAYERRGYINYQLGNFKDALYDFSKSITINPFQAEAFFGRARVKMIKQDWAGALTDFEEAMKKSIALQDFFWKARRGKGEAMMHLKMYKEAAIEFQKFLERPFKSDNPNYSWKRKVMFLYGKALLESGETAQSIKIFNQSLDILEGREFVPDSTVIFTRGLAQKQLGKRELFKKDIEEAARQGLPEAVELLAEIK